MLACLAVIEPLDPATGTRSAVRVSSVNDALHGPKVNGLGGVLWEPAMVQPPTLGLALWNGDFQAAVSPAVAALPINLVTASKTYPGVNAAAWFGAPVTIYAEAPGTAWPWTPRFKGRVTGFSREAQTLRLSAAVDSEPFEANVLTATYAGTGGAEGGADIKNRVKPLALGWPQNVEPVLIDATNNVYQFSGYGPIEAVTKLYERGSDFGAATADYASYAALVAATIPAGRWATCLAQGMVRLGAPAYGIITGDLKGHVTSGAAQRLTGTLISVLSALAGISGSLINTASLSGLNTAVPYPVSVFIDQQSTFIEVAQALALACNYQAGLGLTGEFFVAGVGFGGSEVLKLDAKGRADPQVVASQEAEVSIPYWRTVLGAARSWRVHGADEIAYASSLVERGRYDPSETYREGNIVDSADGSRWVYISATATSGNAPPAWPTTSDSIWDNLVPPQTIDYQTQVTGPGKPADYATASDNVILNPAFAGGGANWTFSGGAVIYAGPTLSSWPAPKIAEVPTGSTGVAEQTTIDWAPQDTWVSLWVFVSAGTAAGQIRGRCFDANGGLLGTVSFTLTAPGSAAWYRIEGMIAKAAFPANTAKVAWGWVNANSSGNTNYATAMRVAPTQSGSTSGADWSANLANRPSELTDGRVAAGLTAGGVVQTDKVVSSSLSFGSASAGSFTQSNVTMALTASFQTVIGHSFIKDLGSTESAMEIEAMVELYAANGGTTANGIGAQLNLEILSGGVIVVQKGFVCSIGGFGAAQTVRINFPMFYYWALNAGTYTAQVRASGQTPFGGYTQEVNGNCIIRVREFKKG